MSGIYPEAHRSPARHRDASIAHSLFISLEPRMIVTDIILPDASGPEAMRRMLLYVPDARVLIFIMYDERTFVKRARWARPPT